MGFISDGSFSGSLAKISIPALAVLINDLLSREQQSEAQRRLRAQDVPGDNLTSMIVSAFGALGRHAAGAAGEKVAVLLGDKVADFFADGLNLAFEWTKDQFP